MRRPQPGVTAGSAVLPDTGLLLEFKLEGTLDAMIKGVHRKWTLPAPPLAVRA